jgi:hypothetical protein
MLRFAQHDKRGQLPHESQSHTPIRRPNLDKLLNDTAWRWRSRIVEKSPRKNEAVTKR